MDEFTRFTSNLDRRGFVRSITAAAAAMTAMNDPLAAARTALGASGLDTIGLQLYTLRSLLAQETERTLAAVAEIGYREVELAGLYGHTPAAMRAMLDRTGLRAVSSHHSLRDVRDNGPATFDAAATLGQRYVVVASLSGDERASAGAFHRVADQFNAAGEAARSRGMQFGYHNHDFEFQAVDGEIPYRILLEHTDPERVAMEMDVFWMVNGGQDPFAYFEANPGRFPLIHAKDRSADGKMVNVGAGIIDFRRIVAQSGVAGIRHVFVEHDQPASPMDDVRASYSFLRSIA